MKSAVLILLLATSIDLFSSDLITFLPLKMTDTSTTTYDSIHVFYDGIQVANYYNNQKISRSELLKYSSVELPNINDKSTIYFDQNNNIVFNSKIESDNSKIEIYDLTGKRLISKNQSINEGINIITTDNKILNNTLCFVNINGKVYTLISHAFSNFASFPKIKNDKFLDNDTFHFIAYHRFYQNAEFDIASDDLLSLDTISFTFDDDIYKYFDSIYFEIGNIKVTYMSGDSIMSYGDDFSITYSSKNPSKEKSKADTIFFYSSNYRRSEYYLSEIIYSFRFVFDIENQMLKNIDYYYRDYGSGTNSSWRHDNGTLCLINSLPLVYDNQANIFKAYSTNKENFLNLKYSRYSGNKFGGQYTRLTEYEFIDGLSFIKIELIPKK